MIIVVDNTLSPKSSKAVYLPRLQNYLRKRQLEFVTVKTLDQFKDAAPAARGIILSGSPLMIKDLRRPIYEQTLMLNMLALVMAHQFNIPVMGICFGCQFIHTAFGGKLSKLQGGLFCKDVIVKDVHKVRFCCTYILTHFPQCFNTLAVANLDGKTTPCWFKHHTLPVYATLFHPEYRTSTYFILDEFIERTQQMRT